MGKSKIEIALDNWIDERNSATIYLALAEMEKDERLAKIFTKMAAVEIKHAEKWQQKIEKLGGIVPEFKPNWRTRALIWLAKRVGPAAVLPSIQAMEQDGTRNYLQQPEAADITADERFHARMLNQITSNVRGGLEGSALAQLEGRHRATGGNALRAAVLGANDGLVSNLSLVMGVAGAALASRQILITGLAGLLAGACSMALGEWLSVQSSRELYKNQIEIERVEIEQSPEGEIEELSLIYQARGLNPEQSLQLATQIMANRESGLDAMVREELGIDPNELGGSAWEAAITSFILFAIGAIIPVIPFIFLSGITAVLVSIGLSTVGLFLLGAAITLFTGKTVLFSGFRMVIFGLLAAAVTYGIGALIGTSLGG